MTARFGGLERALLALFVASGFAGLIYQAIWSHYLGLSLGHAAYAQTLVLAIFMGGMALGAWLVSSRGAQWKRLIFAYAVVEILIGLAGLAFHFVFLGYTDLSQNVVYPALGSESAVRAWQWGSAALLIAPQSVLLGMTFPLMSGGYLRVAPKADGEILGGLYFTNSIGAAFGALFATFALLPWVGMPGAIAIAGAVNVLVGLGAWAISRRTDAQPLPDSERIAAQAPAAGRATITGGFYRMMLLATGLSGAASFVYEIGWIRLLNQALGTTVHSFELMLAAFILGLAFGGLWIRKRSQKVDDAVAYAGYAQIWMGVAALISIPIFSQSFRWVGALMASLPKDDGGYFWYSLGSAGIALLVMFPAAFFAGMTLPLFTMALLRRGAGEASIGRIYAANTLGAIIGVALAVHILIPLMGLRLAVTLAALTDIALGVILLRAFAEKVRPPAYLGALATTLVVVCVSLVFGQLDPKSLASGVFRHGRVELSQQAEVIYLRDGKTATISYFVEGSVATIATNGKPDASIQLITELPPSEDEITMAMAGVLPLAAHPDPATIAIIGWGSGLTTHTVLGSRRPRQVDSIEIESAMHEGAQLFGRSVARAYRDHRSALHVDDARTYFSAGKRRYDVIISEPSNPWVSGVASLFTQEFYRFLRGHLEEGGILVQWLQTYELSDPLLATMLSALIEEYPYVDAYMTNTADLLFLASERPLPPLDFSRLDGQEQLAELRRVGLSRTGDLQVRQVGDRSTIQALVAMYDATPHSDFYPVVALEAPKARFTGESVASFRLLMGVGMPLLEMTGGRSPVSRSGGVTFSPVSISATEHAIARAMRANLLGEPIAGLGAEEFPKVNQEQVSRLVALSGSPVTEAGLSEWLDAVSLMADFNLGYLPLEDHDGVWVNPRWIDLGSQPETVRAVMAAYAAAAARDGAAMHRDGLAALEAIGSVEPSLVHEQMILIARLGAIASGDWTSADSIEREYGAKAPPRTQHYTFGRTFLSAWLEKAAVRR